MRIHGLPALSGHITALFVFAVAAGAAPSGGPYGPLQRRYAVPKAPHVYFVAPDGKADAAGTLNAPTTLASAMTKAVTGDAVILRGGVYRTGSIEFNQKVTIQPYLDEHPVLKGTEVASGWTQVSPTVWKTSWTKLFPAAPLAWWNRAKEEAKTPLHRFNNDMVFVDGRFLQSSGGVAEVNENTYFIDYAAKEVYVGADPATHTVEITAHDGALIRTARAVNGKLNDHKGPIIRGLTITQYARRCLEIEGKKTFGPNDEPTDEPIGKTDPKEFGKEAVGSVIENNTISYCSRVGGWFRGDNMIIRSNLFTDTSTEGIYVIGSTNVRVEKNIVRRNNIEQLTGYFPGAVKIFNQTNHVVFHDNLVLENPYSNGVWYDVGNNDAVFTDNYVEGALVGFFFEISNSATVAGNVFVKNGKGTWALNSSNVHVYNNTYIDNPAAFSRTERQPTGDVFAWHSSTGPNVDQRVGHKLVNNLMVASATYKGPLLLVEQSSVLCGKLTNAPLSEVNGNVYVRAPGSSANTAEWAPVESKDCTAKASHLADLRRIVPGVEAKGREMTATTQDIFKAPDFLRFEQRLSLKSLVATPATVLKYMGVKAAATVGAYPAAATAKKK